MVRLVQSSPTGSTPGAFAPKLGGPIIRRGGSEGVRVHE